MASKCIATYIVKYRVTLAGMSKIATMQMCICVVLIHYKD